MIHVQELESFLGRWPAELSNRFRGTLATQWRLTMAIRSRQPGAASDSAALDELFAEADAALAAVNELSESLVPEVRGACASSKVVFLVSARWMASSNVTAGGDERGREGGGGPAAGRS